MDEWTTQAFRQRFYVFSTLSVFHAPTKRGGECAIQPEHIYIFRLFCVRMFVRRGKITVTTRRRRRPPNVYDNAVDDANRRATPPPPRDRRGRNKFVCVSESSTRRVALPRGVCSILCITAHEIRASVSIGRRVPKRRDANAPNRVTRALHHSSAPTTAICRQTKPWGRSPKRVCINIVRVLLSGKRKRNGATATRQAVSDTSTHAHEYITYTATHIHD